MPKQIESYRHINPLGQTADTRDGDYFVSAVDGNQFALVSGPYVTHTEAINAVPECRRLVETVDSRAVFYAFGTCRLAVNSGRIGFIERHALRAVVDDTIPTRPVDAGIELL